MDNGGHWVGTMGWLKYQAEQVGYLYERVSAEEAAARLYLVINEYNKLKGAHHEEHTRTGGARASRHA